MNIEKLVKNFQSRGYVVRVFDTAEQANNFILEQTDGMSVGLGGSMTVEQMGLFNLLEKRGNAHWHFHSGSKEDICRAAAAQAYISGINALSETGEIVNIDGNGNRVSASIYGAEREKSFFVCGINKITENLDKALWRAKNVAAPLNARRLGRKTPCAAKADKCYNCNCEDRICRVTAVFTHPTNKVETFLIIVRENLGY